MQCGSPGTIDYCCPLQVNGLLSRADGILEELNVVQKQMELVQRGSPMGSPLPHMLRVDPEMAASGLFKDSKLFGTLLPPASEEESKAPSGYFPLKIPQTPLLQPDGAPQAGPDGMMLKQEDGGEVDQDYPMSVEEPDGPPNWKGEEPAKGFDAAM